MENCSGGELIQKIFEKLSKGESFSEKEAVPIFKQSISAICYSNIHRELKLENILFLNKKPDSPIKISDFELSKIFGEIKSLIIIILEAI